MKKFLLFIAVIAVITGCSKKDSNIDNPADIWNGYQNLKYSTITVDLFAGQHIDVGSVTFVITEDVIITEDGDEYYSETASFQATYNLEDGWEMSESHLYAGGIDELPTNKPGAPKIGKFPYKEDHNPKVTSYTYSIPIMDLPAYDDGVEGNFIGGFVVAAHCVVSHPTQGQETGWADCNHSFSDKGWGSYMDNYFDQAIDIDVLYGIQDDGNGLVSLVHINTWSGDGDIIFSESVTGSSGSAGAAAYDSELETLFFVIGNTLYANDLSSDTGTEEIVTLSGTPTGGSFYNGNYYYFDTSTNSIIEIELSYDDGWTVDATNTLISGGFPSGADGIDIIDIAISSDGSTMYLIGSNGSVVNLLSFNMGSNTYDISVISTTLSDLAQIAFGSDGTLYAIDIVNGTSELIILDTLTGNGGSATNDEDDAIIIDLELKSFTGGAFL